MNRSLVWMKHLSIPLSCQRTITKWLAMIALLMLAALSHAATCTKTGTICVDATPCKMISGVSVCLTDPGVNATCWKYTDTYNCLAQAPVDYCAAIASTSGCIQTGSVCAPGATTATGCSRWTNTFRCGGGTTPPASMMVLNTSHTVITQPTLATQCALPTDNPTCTVAEDVAGVKSYTCLSQPSTCAPLMSKGCTLSTSTCMSPAGGNAANCLLYENSYSCPSTTPPSTVMNCGSNQYCTGGNCFNTGHAPDSDLAQAVIAHEISREATTYMDANQKIFSGNAESCNQNALGKCCDPKGGAVRNSSIGGNILTTVGGQAVVAGSSYMFDAMYSGYQAYRAMSAMSATATFASSAAASAAASSAFTMSSYGLTMTYSASAGFSFAFDPTSFAVAVAIYIIMDLSSCDPAEKMLAQKNGAGLCREVPGGGCVGFFCVNYQHKFCCFNSILAKIINNAGVSQLGRAATDCSGLTMAEFDRIDFAQIDFSEFIATIMSAVKFPSNGPINTDANNTMTRKLANYYRTGKQ